MRRAAHVVRHLRPLRSIGVAQRSLMTFPQRNPKTGEVFAEYEEMSEEKVQSSLLAADNAYRQWRTVPAARRATLLAPLAAGLRDNSDSAAKLISTEMGKPLGQAKAEVLKCAQLVDWYAEHAPDLLKDTEHPALPGFTRCFVTYRPLGAILSIMPWNFPLWQVIRMAVPTMIAGNSVMLKHAPNCFGTARYCEDLIGSLPDLPSGLFQALIVDVPVVKTVLESPMVQGVALTGSERAGRAGASLAGSLLKKAVVELGGSDAYIVLEDADLDQAADAVVTGRVMNTGQCCIGPKRAVVVSEVKADFERKVLERLKAKVYGVDFGPLVHAQASEQVRRQVASSTSSGARLLAGGPGVPPPEGDIGGAFFAPTVLTDVKPGMAAFDEEIFGPVISIVEARDGVHAVELANQSDYGLGGAVFTKDVERGTRMAVGDVEAGMCFVNDMARSDPSLPFGGIKNSGIGRECAVFGLLEFTNIKTICVK